MTEPITPILRLQYGIKKFFLYLLFGFMACILIGFILGSSTAHSYIDYKVKFLDIFSLVKAPIVLGAFLLSLHDALLNTINNKVFDKLVWKILVFQFLIGVLIDVLRRV